MKVFQWEIKCGGDAAFICFSTIMKHRQVYPVFHLVYVLLRLIYAVDEILPVLRTFCPYVAFMLSQHKCCSATINRGGIIGRSSAGIGETTKGKQQREFFCSISNKLNEKTNTNTLKWNQPINNPYSGPPLWDVSLNHASIKYILKEYDGLNL